MSSEGALLGRERPSSRAVCLLTNQKQEGAGGKVVGHCGERKLHRYRAVCLGTSPRSDVHFLVKEH